MTTFLMVKIALLPFAAFWALLGAGHTAWAVGAGVVLSLAGNLWRWRRGSLMVLEVGGLVLFGALLLSWLAAPAWTSANALWVSFAGLGLVSLFSVVLGRPWTSDYARAAHPDATGTAQFRLINAAISGTWGVLFLAIALCRWLEAPAAVPAVIVLLGALLSILGPRLAIRLALQRLAGARETWRWPAPAFGAPGSDCDVAVIGAGIGGLSAAALLADAGLKVRVFEQHVLPGGFCHTYLRKAHHDNKPVLYRFDAGPHDFSGVWPGGPVTGLLERLGVADRLRWKRVTHRFHLAGTVIDVPEDWRDYVRLLGDRFPESAAAIAQLFETIHAIYEGMFATGRERSGIPGPPDSVEAMLAFPSQYPLAFKWMNEPFARLVTSHVSDPAVIRTLNALAGYLGDGSEPLTCAQMVPVFGYYFKGGHYPVGGSGRLADVLVEAITARGGEVHLKTPVRRVLVESGRAAGVVLADGRTIRSAAVVSNADLKRTLLDLVDPEQLPAQFRNALSAAPPATSAFSVHLGLSCQPDLPPATHLDTPMGLGIAMMSKLDPSAAPAGHATLTLISIVPHDVARGWFPAEGGDDWKAWRRSPDYEARKQALGDRMVAAAETVIPGLSQHIVYRTDASPVTYARYDWSSAGAIYGMSRAGRIAGSKSPLPNLVIAGGGNVGAGVEAVLISGAQAANALLPGLLRSGPAAALSR